MALLFAQRLDLRDLSGAELQRRAALAIDVALPGDLLEIRSRDPFSAARFSDLARSTGDVLLESSQFGDEYRFVIRKR
jgi:TusA-related sulfurtransferase